MVFRNLGFQLKPYNEVHESLPFEINLGVSQKLENAPITWHITLENIQKVCILAIIYLSFEIGNSQKYL